MTKNNIIIIRVPTVPEKREKVWNFEKIVPGLINVLIFMPSGTNQDKAGKSDYQFGYKTSSTCHTCK
jgi:hypothetical protein